MSDGIAVVWRKRKRMDVFYIALHCFDVTCFVQAFHEYVQHH